MGIAEGLCDDCKANLSGGLEQAQSQGASTKREVHMRWACSVDGYVDVTLTYGEPTGVATSEEPPAEEDQDQSA